MMKFEVKHFEYEPPKGKKKYLSVINVSLILMVFSTFVLLAGFYWYNNRPVDTLKNETEDLSALVDTEFIEQAISKEEPLAEEQTKEKPQDELVFQVRDEYTYAVKETMEPVDDNYFDDAIFFGDSITTGIPHYMEKEYPNIMVVAERGINLYNVLTEEKIRTTDGEFKTLLDAADEYGDRKKIYVLLGGNDLGYEEKVFIKSYRDFVIKLKEKYPDAIIYLQSITPVTETEDQLKNYKYSNNEVINKFNLLIMEMAEEEGVYYLDIASALMNKDGKLPEESSTDGVHFKKEYYEKWIEYLKLHTAQ